MIVSGVCAYAFEQIVQWRYGVAGMLAFGLLSLGHKSRNVTCTAIGLTALALLLAQ